MNGIKKSAHPFVSVVTPVYNGGKYISECIESVIDQTYTNWEYVILNNCSTDNTLEIAKKYARDDERIRIYNNDEFLKQIPNWNAALQKISGNSKYCKEVHADDWLVPECLEKWWKGQSNIPRQELSVHTVVKEAKLML